MKDIVFLKIADLETSDQVWQKELDRINYELAAAYYAEYFRDNFKDHSFLIISDLELVGYCICFQIDGKLSFPAEGLKVILLTEKIKNTPKIYSKISAHLEEIAKHNACKEIIIKDTLPNGRLSFLGEALFNSEYNSRLTFEMLVNLEGFNEATYFSNIRKSYKSLVNWGKRELQIELINKDNLSYERFLKYKDFHKKVAGRQTRSDKSWDIQYQMLEQGHGELVLGNYQNNLVAGSLFINQFEETVYFTGVYERELFDYGISHHLLYKGICRSSEHSLTKAVALGIFDTDISDRKLYNIQFFKKGFCNDFVPTVFWSKNLNY